MSSITKFAFPGHFQENLPQRDEEAFIGAFALGAFFAQGWAYVPYPWSFSFPECDAPWQEA